MKRIEVIRGGQKFPMKTQSGDYYDSILTIYDNNFPVDKFEWVNTDPSENATGQTGILAEGIYNFVVTDFKKKYITPLIVNKVPVTNPDTDYILPSLIPNPNHGGKKIITAVFIHCGGNITDGSLGCITIYPFDWPRFKSHWGRKYETGEFILKRADDWTPPAKYNG